MEFMFRDSSDCHKFLVRSTILGQLLRKEELTILETSCYFRREERLYVEGMEDEDIKKETQNLAYPPAFKLGKIAHPPNFKVGKVAYPPAFKQGKIAHPSNFKLGKVAYPTGFRLGKVIYPPDFKLMEYILVSIQPCSGMNKIKKFSWIDLSRFFCF